MDLKIMSYNLLCYGPDEFDWTLRRPIVVDIIKKELPDSFGVQEAHYDWMKFLDNSLSEYEYAGIGREGGTKGEFSAVFYLKDKFNLLDSGTFWLAENPDLPAKGWDAACYRVCTFAKLQNKISGEVYVHMNTHLDHMGPEARTKGLQLVLDYAEKFNEPTVLTGDFNFPEGCELYEQMTSGKFIDSKYATDNRMDHYTFNAFFPYMNREDELEIIDFVNVTKDIKVNSYKVITDKPDGKFPSDHFPVVAEIEI